MEEAGAKVYDMSEEKRLAEKAAAEKAEKEEAEKDKAEIKSAFRFKTV